MAEENTQPTNKNEVIPLEDMTNGQLQNTAIELGFPEVAARSIKTKTALIETIAHLESQVANKAQDKKEKTVKFEDADRGAGDRESVDKKEWSGKAGRMAKIVREAELVPYYIPVEYTGKDKLMHVQMNGWMPEPGVDHGCVAPGKYPSGRRIKRMSKVIADFLDEQFESTEKAGEEIRYDRKDADSGKTIREVLA